VQFRAVLRKIGYSKIIPRGVLRVCDDLLLLPAMWLPGSGLRKFFNRLRGVKIGKDVWVGQGTILGNHPFLLEIRDHVIISAGVKILTHDTSFTVVGGRDLAAEVVIGSNLQIGENAIILPGVTIGNNCIIGANSVVTRNIPDNSIVAGVPARIIGSTMDTPKKIDEKLRTGKYFSTW
jgi:acetyltransferase-like isoleucine patch superfamily enzyme